LSQPVTRLFEKLILHAAADDFQRAAVNLFRDRLDQ
jgi:hypothetical protein